MSKYIAAGIIALIIVGGVGGYIYALRSANASLASSVEALGKENGEFRAANEAQSEAIGKMERSAAATDALVAGVLAQNELLNASSRVLERKLKEALNAAPALTLDSFLPHDAAYALCLQHHKASAGIGASDRADPAGGAPLGEGYSAAHDCGRWGRVTVREAVEYVSALTEALGRERNDKIGLNRWVQEVTDGPANNRP